MLSFVCPSNKLKDYSEKPVNQRSAQRPANPAGICLFKVTNGNTRTMFEICSELTIKTPEQRQ